jgi:hypothetical protein
MLWGGNDVVAAPLPEPARAVARRRRYLAW